MVNLSLGEWIALASLAVAIVGVFYTYKSYKKNSRVNINNNISNNNNNNSNIVFGGNQTINNNEKR